MTPAAAVVHAARAAALRSFDREALTAAVAGRLSALGAPADSIAAAERLRAPGTVAVVTGQQPVLFGGPWFVATKALHAIAAARDLEASGIPAVPVFWAATEDHDHAEVDHVEVLTDAGGLERVAVPLPGDRTMLSRTPLDAMAAHARLAEVLPRGPGRAAALAAAEPIAGDTVGSSFVRTLLRLLGRFGLVVVEPETLRPVARGVVRHEIEHPGELSAAIAAAEDSVVAKGGERPLGVRRGPLFFVVDRRGRRHRPQGLPVAGDAAGVAKWLARLDERPGEFSWDVAGRVLAQDIALPVAAQICGPSEVRYCDVVGAALPLLGVEAPALIGRIPVRVEAADRPSAGDDDRRIAILSFVARHGERILDDALAAIAASRDGTAVVRPGGA